MTALLKPIPEPYAVRVFVDPALADYMLKHGRPNRKLIRAAIDQFSREMKAGRWKLDGATLRVDRNGRTLDGYHRLTACVEAGVGFWTFIVYDLEPEVFDTIDTGTSRNTAQILQMSGEPFSYPLASTTKLMIRFQGGKTQLNYGSNTDKLSPQEVKTVISANPDLRDSVAFIYNNCPKLLQFGGSPSVAALIHMYGSRRHGAEYTEQFFRALDSGIDLQHGSPIHALREKLWSYKRQGARRQMEILGTYLPAWNAHVLGKRMVRLNPIDWTKPEIDLTIR